MLVNRRNDYWRAILTFTLFYKDFGGFINKAVFRSNDNINEGIFIINQIFQDFIFSIFGVLNFNNILNLTKRIVHIFALIFSRGLISNIENDRGKTFNIT